MMTAHAAKRVFDRGLDAPEKAAKYTDGREGFRC